MKILNNYITGISNNPQEKTGVAFLQAQVKYSDKKKTKSKGESSFSTV